MSKIDDGGTAFPLPYGTTPAGQIVTSIPGMTMRDWFAGKALVGFLSSNFNKGKTSDSWNAKYCAEMAYLLADAMLAERKRTQEGV